jgi:16S rRNA (guanine527-N7)-methyltransferase
MNQELKERIQQAWPELEGEVVDKIILFHGLLAAENEKQNLTRLISPKDFVEGHLLDVREIQRSKLLDFPAMDLGSGCGVPGLLSAIIRPDAWILAESERNKAEFLFRMVRELSLTTVRVVADRGESFLSDGVANSVVARAVGPVERIYGWLQPCSTWNNLVLLKGPGWATEWETFGASRFAGELQVSKTHEYVVGDEQKRRVIVKLDRVPRGT